MGDPTAGALLFTDDDVAGPVIVAINPAYSARGQRQTRMNCSRARENGCPSGKLGNGIEITAFALPIFHHSTDATSR